MNGRMAVFLKSMAVFLKSMAVFLKSEPTTLNIVTLR